MSNNSPIRCLAFFAVSILISLTIPVLMLGGYAFAADKPSSISPHVASSQESENPVLKQPATKPQIKKVSKLKASKFNNKKISLSWRKVPNATKYEVLYKAMGGKWRRAYSSKNRFTAKKLKYNTKYYFKVRACNEQKETSTTLGLQSWGRFSKAISVKEGITKKQQAIVRSAKRTPSTASGYCAKWITSVFLRAGLPYFEGHARDMYKNYCKTSDRSKLKVGMLVCVDKHPLSRLGGIYGHACVYIGDGKVMYSSGGKVHTRSLSWCIKYYGTKSHPVKWGFPYRHFA